MWTHRLAVLIALSGIPLGCAVSPAGADPAAVCEEAEAHVAACFTDREVEAGPCDVDTAEAVLAADCEELAAVDGKADHFLCTPFTWFLCGLGDPRPERLAIRVSYPRDIALSNGWVYYLSDTEDGEVLRVPADGGRPEVIADGQDRPAALGVDATHVYWITSGGDPRASVLFRAPRDGGAAEQLADGLPWMLDLALGEDEVFLSGSGGVYAAPKAGGAARQVSDLGSEPTKSAPNITFHEGALYVISSWHQGRLLRLDPVSGDTLVLAENVGTGPMAIEEGVLYWSDIAGISSVPIGGGPVTLLAAVDGGNGGLVLTDGGLAFTHFVGDTVSHLDLETLEVTTLARRQDGPGSIAHEDGVLYFLNNGTSFVLDYNHDGEVVRLEMP